MLRSREAVRVGVGARVAFVTDAEPLLGTTCLRVDARVYVSMGPCMSVCRWIVAALSGNTARTVRRSPIRIYAGL
jgi:hypothetical protein